MAKAMNKDTAPRGNCRMIKKKMPIATNRMSSDNIAQPEVGLIVFSMVEIDFDMILI